METRGIKIYFDDRKGVEEWNTYSREATKAEHAAKTEIGQGFHECLNFAFSHPDNKPLVKLYLPAGYRPSAANPLLLFASYKQQKNTAYPGHWVGAAASASILDQDGIRSKTKRELYYIAVADPALVTRFVAPVPIDTAKDLGGKTWFRKPVEIPYPGRVLKRAAVLAAALLPAATGAENKAIVRQLATIERILAQLDANETTSEGGDDQSDGKANGVGWQADAELGTLAEHLVVADQAKLLVDLRKAYPDCPKAPTHLALTEHTADHDVESAIEIGKGWKKLLIEVKATKSKTWQTVLISERQVARARKCAQAQSSAVHRFAIVDFSHGLKKKPKIHYLTLSALEKKFMFAPLKYQLRAR